MESKIKLRIIKFYGSGDLGYGLSITPIYISTDLRTHIENWSIEHNIRISIQNGDFFLSKSVILFPNTPSNYKNRSILFINYTERENWIKEFNKLLSEWVK